MKITLYEFAPTRSARCRWLLQELGLEFEAVDVYNSGFGETDEWKTINPFASIPAIRIDDQTLFQSAAICTWLADLHPDKGLIPAVGTHDRALYDQWTQFALCEMEAWLWHSAKHTFRYPKEERMKEVIPKNSEEVKDALGVLEKALEGKEYLVGGAFGVTDINMGYTLDWARRMELTGGFEKVGAYLERLCARPHCTLGKD